MKKIALALCVSALSFFSTESKALEVGETAACIVLDVVYPDGSVVNQCIRARSGEAKFTILEYSQTQCGACIENLPALSQLSKDVEAQATTRLVYIDRNRQASLNFIEANREYISFSAALDNNRTATNAYGIEATPTLFILDSSNVVVYKHIGTLSSADVAAIKTLVGAN